MGSIFTKGEYKLVWADTLKNKVLIYPHQPLKWFTGKQWFTRESGTVRILNLVGPEESWWGLRRGDCRET